MSHLWQALRSGSYYGKLAILVGLLLGVPPLVLFFYPQEARYLPAFLLPMLGSVTLGLVVSIVFRHTGEAVTEWQSPLQRGSLPVLFAWCYGILAGALPFVLGGQLRFSHALFESASGWTTTGLSVVADVTALPHIFLFHRAFMQCCGGLGFILMMALVVQGKQSMNLYSAEGHLDRLRPNLRRTSRVIFLIYCGCHAVGILLYRLFGMALFDAICHTMSALSTAGFTTQAGSIGSYASVPVEMVTTLLMLVGASNFAVLYLLTEGKLRRLFRITEMRVMLGLLVIFVPLCALALFSAYDIGILESLRQALFGVVSIFTTTGYSTMNYAAWPPFAVGLSLLLMIIGGSTGSTAGGIKLARVYYILRITRENIKTRLSPARRVTAPTYVAPQGDSPIDRTLISDTFGFLTCYAGVLIIGTLLLTLTAGCTVEQALFEFASALGTVGVSNGVTNPGMNLGTLLVEMAAMLLGRLELFIVFIGVFTAAREVKHKLFPGRRK